MILRMRGIFLLVFCQVFGTASAANDTNDGWVTLFDGSSLHGWLASDSKDTFQLRDGMLVTNGDRSHLFYVGDVNGGKFRNGEWFTTHIIVQGKKITLRIDDRTVVEWEQPDDWPGLKDYPQRKIDAGTFALQGHDSDSTVYYRNIRVKPLSE